MRLLLINDVTKEQVGVFRNNEQLYAHIRKNRLNWMDYRVKGISRWKSLTKRY